MPKVLYNILNQLSFLITLDLEMKIFLRVIILTNISHIPAMRVSFIKLELRFHSVKIHIDPPTHHSIQFSDFVHPGCFVLEVLVFNKSFVKTIQFSDHTHGLQKTI